MNRTNFYVAVFDGTIEEVAEYIRKNYDGREWDCPTGREDVEGIISVLSGGLDGWEDTAEVDGIGNIRLRGDLETFASIVEDGEED